VNSNVGHIKSFIYQTIGDDLMAKALLKDEVANGVQFLGSENVNKVALGVSLSEDFLNEAVASKADFCLFHHGFDTRVWKSRFPLFAQKRLKVMVENKLTVMGLHYALDSHPKIGNNATIIKLLGAKIKQPLFDEWGYTAKFDQPQSVNDLQQKCAELFHHDILAVLGDPKQVTTIGVVSGRGVPEPSHIAEMQDKGVELFISGETSEWTIHQMKESNINYFSCGHYATEVFGVQELGKVIKAYFKDQLEVEFIDIPNIV
jgi:dinuclear metal center YbgI/SA1388 family protein